MDRVLLRVYVFAQIITEVSLKSLADSMGADRYIVLLQINNHVNVKGDLLDFIYSNSF